MNKIGTISVLHVIFLSMTVIGLKNHVTILPSLLQNAGRDSWMSVVAAAILTVPWIFLLIYIHKKTNREPLNDWLDSKIGKASSSIIRYSTAIFLLIVAAFTLVETLLWIMSTFLPKSPLTILLLIYAVLCILLPSTNLQTIVIANVFVLFWVVILGFFVAITNIQVKEYQLLLPLLEHGVRPVLSSVVYPASGFVELLLFLFLQHQVKSPFRWYHFAVMLFIIMGLTLGPLTGAITEFGPAEAAKQRFPAFEEWGLASIGRFIEHLDFLSIYQWLTGAFIRVGFILYVVTDLLKMTGDRIRIWKLIAPPFLFLCASLFLMDDNLLLKLKGELVLTGTFVFLFLLSLLLAIIAAVSKKSSTNSLTK